MMVTVTTPSCQHDGYCDNPLITSWRAALRVGLAVWVCLTTERMGAAQGLGNWSFQIPAKNAPVLFPMSCTVYMNVYEIKTKPYTYMETIPVLFYEFHTVKFRGI